MRKIHLTKEIICIRGAGDIATGVIQKFARSGFRVFALETAQPTTIRRQVALSSAIGEGEIQVEDIRARQSDRTLEAMQECWSQGIVPVVSDPAGESIKMIKPSAVIDAILAKQNIGTNRQMAPVTIGLGPGFTAGEDVDIVIETMRGHRLGQMIQQGAALPNTGTPGEIGGQSGLRVIHAPVSGVVRHFAGIGEWLVKDQPLLQVGNVIVTAPFDGMVRGLIAAGMDVKKGLKIADIDPRRLSREECFGISDKARCIGGAALEAYLFLTAVIRA